jgi:hypothetical protein
MLPREARYIFSFRTRVSESAPPSFGGADFVEESDQWKYFSGEAAEAKPGLPDSKSNTRFGGFGNLLR